MTAPEWTEVEHDGTRARYRPKRLKGFDVEYWHDGRREWRAVQRVNARDWFGLGFRAGMEAPVQEEMKL